MDTIGIFGLVILVGLNLFITVLSDMRNKKRNDDVMHWLCEIINKVEKLVEVEK